MNNLTAAVKALLCIRRGRKVRLVTWKTIPLPRSNPDRPKNELGDAAGLQSADPRSSVLAKNGDSYHIQPSALPSEALRD